MGQASTLGIECLDREHLELRQLFDEFAEAIMGESSVEQAREIVQRAITAANHHFEHEEEIAAQANYPKIDEEKFHHRHLRLQITTLAGDTLNFKCHDPVTRGNLAAIRSLLDEHIAGPDKDLADYLRSREAV